MRWRLPTWIVPVNIWRFTTPTSHAPDATAVGNFTPGRRVYSGSIGPSPSPATWFPVMFLLLPDGTDIRGEARNTGEPDTVEIPAGSGRMYSCIFVDYVALGFANQHLQAVVTQVPDSPPVGGDLLLEDSTALLLEDSTDFLLE